MCIDSAFITNLDLTRGHQELNFLTTIGKLTEKLPKRIVHISEFYMVP